MKNVIIMVAVAAIIVIVIAITRNRRRRRQIEPLKIMILNEIINKVKWSDRVYSLSDLEFIEKRDELLGEWEKQLIEIKI